MLPLQRATVIEMLKLLLKAKQVRHVVVSRIARQRRITVKLAFSVRCKLSHFMQKSRHIIQKIHRHHRRRDWRIAHQFPGQHRNSISLEKLINRVKIIQFWQKQLVAIHQIIQGTGFILSELQHFQVTEVTVCRLPFTVKMLGWLGGQQTPQVLALHVRDALQHSILFRQIKVQNLHPFRAIFRHQCLVHSDMLRLAAILGNHHGNTPRVTV